ncbi:MAG TPA: response regulator transcription factor [Thermomicrobiales bacterium]|nr:response regulator transcription factor [Thermomicrobiales bacterium]
MRILVVEDEVRLAEMIAQGLGDEGHAVTTVHSGEDALDHATVSDFDAIVLDVMLPGISGIDVCRSLRARRIQTPILILTARDAVEDRVAGLDAGADDYMIKPFAFAELSARLRALSRRPPESLDPVLQVGELRLDPATHQVWRGDEEFVLPNKEFRILEYLMRHPNQVLTRAMITDHVWDYDFPSSANVVDVHIRSLRRKLEDPYEKKHIQTVRGVGYRIVDPDA